MNTTTKRNQAFEELIAVEIERKKLEDQANGLRLQLGLGLIPGTVFNGMRRLGRKKKLTEGQEVEDPSTSEVVGMVGRAYIKDTLGRMQPTKKVLSPAARQKIREGSAHAKEARRQNLSARTRQASPADGQTQSARKPLGTPAQQAARAANAMKAREANSAKVAERKRLEAIAALPKDSLGRPKTPRRPSTPEEKAARAERMREVTRRLLAEGRHSTQLRKKAAGDAH